MSGLYDHMNFKRVYFSAYQRGSGSPDIPGEQKNLSGPDEPFMREHRLYQVDFLLRSYGFSGADIPLDAGGNLPLDKDPKQRWADLHPEWYPVRINAADIEALLRVPGIGPDTARKIVKVRKERRIDQLEDLGVTGKRLDKIKQYVVLE
jgi:predicted DNA-binding helix-hairpin-helix protein